MKKKLTLFLILMLLLLLNSCGKQKIEQPLVTAETKEVQAVIENIEFVKSTDKNSIDKVVMCYGDAHKDEVKYTTCERCIEIVDDKAIEQLHDAMNNMIYAVEPYSKDDIYDGMAIYPIYYVIDGKTLSIGWWHNDIVYPRDSAYIYGGKEQLRITYSEDYSKPHEILDEYYEYRPVDEKKATQKVLDKLKTIGQIERVQSLSEFGGVSNEYVITDSERISELTNILSDIKLSDFASEYQQGKSFSEYWWSDIVVSTDNVKYSIRIAKREVGRIEMVLIRCSIVNGDDGLYYEIINSEEIEEELKNYFKQQTPETLY